MTTIRFATASDAGALAVLVGSFPTPTPPSAQAFSAALSLKLLDPSSCLIVAEQDAELVGYVAGYAHPTFYAGGPTAWVDELLVAETWRGRGLGRQLMDAFETWARSRDSVLISLATRGAAAFYEHLGYASKAAYYKKYLVADSSQASYSVRTE